jgi:hypothetical protein
MAIYDRYLLLEHVQTLLLVLLLGAAAGAAAAASQSPFTRLKLQARAFNSCSAFLHRCHAAM